MMSDPVNREEGDPSFDVDGMLGRLAKWLRIMGFDAAFPRSAPSEGRVFVTMKKDVRRPGSVSITKIGPMDQLAEFLEQTGIDPNPARVLSRCLVCNVPVGETTRERAAGRVPDRVLRTSSSFNECPRCGRIYWEGTHGERIRKRLKKVHGWTDPTGVDSSSAD
ncbi:MAG: Mut7-C RNAse domain-containing protein [Deltaproteobacteria bacterium]